MILHKPYESRQLWRMQEQPTPWTHSTHRIFERRLLATTGSGRDCMLQQAPRFASTRSCRSRWQVANMLAVLVRRLLQTCNRLSCRR